MAVRDGIAATQKGNWGPLTQWSDHPRDSTGKLGNISVLSVNTCSERQWGLQQPEWLYPYPSAQHLISYRG